MIFLPVRQRTFWFIFIADIFSIIFSFYISFLLRFDFRIPDQYFLLLNNYLALFVGVKILVFVFYQLYRGMWRYTSIKDLFKIIKANFLSTLILVTAIIFLHNFRGFPRSVFVLDFMLSTALISMSRISIRLYFSRKSHSDFLPLIKRNNRNYTRLIIIGAGDAGEKILRELRDNPAMDYQIVGFLDDDRKKKRSLIHGVPVLGLIPEIKSITEQFDEILICIPSATSSQMRRIVELCEATGKPYKTLPGIGELINGTVSVKNVRDVSMVDLLGRDEIHLDVNSIKRFLQGKRVLITGAGGSIGSELVQQCLCYGPELLVLLDISENNLFQVERESRSVSTECNFTSILNDIRNKDSLEFVFNRFHPQVVLHAAAYKHVPIQEMHPWEAVFTNIQGSLNLIELASKNGVESFVMVSTDKAVHPGSVMGATKRVVELLIQEWNSICNTCFMAVRFGNIIGSSGSVIPIFQEQVAQGGTVTVTHPNMTRYFMSTPEASQLILQAGAIGKGGEIFVLEMGEPINIDTLARDLIRLSGFEPDIDIPIKYIGLRPGEKMNEQLITVSENVIPTEHEKIMVLRCEGGNDTMLKDHVEELFHIARNYDAKAIKMKLMEIVPEYTPDLSFEA